MYVKVFEQILDSSIANNYELRHFFEDMLKLADKTGVVDMTPDAIARRINLPIQKVTPLLVELAKPDLHSRTPKNDGRRIILVDSHRDWGWIIVNYEHYRALRTAEERRLYFRDAKRKEREKKKKPGRVMVQQPDHNNEKAFHDQPPPDMPTREMIREDLLAMQNGAGNGAGD